MPNTTFDFSSTGGSNRYQPFVPSPVSTSDAAMRDMMMIKTASPIRHMDTSVGMAGGSLAEDGGSQERARRNSGLRASADPSPPAILRIGPPALLHLQPAPRRPRLVQARFFLGDQALVVVGDHLGPRLKAILGEPAHRQHELAPSDDVL